jgi:hypothetical protein
VTSEIVNTPVVAGRNYIMGYDYQARLRNNCNSPNYMDEFFVRLYSSAGPLPGCNTNTFNMPAIPAGMISTIADHFVIGGPTPGISLAERITVFQAGGTPGTQYNRVWLYPRDNSPTLVICIVGSDTINNQPFFNITNLRLYEVSAGDDALLECGATVTLGCPNADIATAFPTATFTWTLNGNTVGTGPNLTVTNNNTTPNQIVQTYTLTVTVNGQSTSDTVVVTMNPSVIPLPILATPLPANSCDQVYNSIISNYNANYIYSYILNNNQPVVFTGPNLTINLTGFGAFDLIIIVTDSSGGCKSELKAHIEGCCLPTVPYNLLVTPNTFNTASQVNAFFAVSPGSPITQQYIVIQGPFIVDENFSLLQSEVMMGDNQSILVQPGSTFAFHYSYLHGCNSMWKEIRVMPGASMYMRGSIIEDGKTAIMLFDSSNFHAGGSIFNKNRLGILHIGANPNYVSNNSITHCGFGSNVLTGTWNNQNTWQFYNIPQGSNMSINSAFTNIPAQLMPPFANQNFSNAGIAIQGIGHWNINQFLGGPTQTIGNYFINNLFHIYANRAGITVSNSFFDSNSNLGQANTTSLYGLLSPGLMTSTFTGTAIGAENHSNILRTINVGDQFGSSNTFMNNTTSIAVSGNLNLLCTNANFQNCSSFINIRQTPSNANINIQANQGSFASDFAVFGYDNRANTLIRKNVFNNLQRVGVAWRSVLPNNAYVRIADHPEISGSGMLRGIEAMNYSSNLRIENNGNTTNTGIIFLASSANIANGASRVGIYIENCNNAVIKDNSVTRPISSSGDFTSTSTALKLKGIMATNCLNTTICNNIMYRMGLSLNMDANCGSAKINLNKFNNSYHGVYLSNLAIVANPGITGCNPGDNEWNGNIATLKMVGNTPPIPSPQQKWNFRNDGTSKDLTNVLFTVSVGGSFMANPCSSTSPLAACNTPSVQLMISPQWREENFGYIVGDDMNLGDSMVYKVMKFAEVNYAYKELKNDTTLFQSDDSLDMQFQDFVLHQDSTYMGHFFNYENALSDKNWTEAQNYINMVADTQLIVQTLKNVYQIYLNHMKNDTLLLDDDERNFLDIKANMNKYETGLGVLLAQIMLNYFPENIDKNNNTIDLPISKPIQNEFILFPNPTDGLVYLNRIPDKNEELKIEIFDSNGKCLLVRSFKNEKASIALNINHLPSGMYIEKITSNQNGVFSYKLILTK